MLTKVLLILRGMGGGMPGQAGMPAGGTADDLGKGSSLDLLSCLYIVNNLLLQCVQLKLNT